MSSTKIYTRLFFSQQQKPLPPLALLVGGWVILGADLGALGLRKLSNTCREANHDFSPVWPADYSL